MINRRNFTKSSLLSIGSVFFIPKNTSGLQLNEPELCRGKYFTEEQGKNFLKEHTPSNLTSWKSRRDQIKAQIIKGLELEKMPQKVSSKAVIHSKKIMNGYSVENVYFESLPGVYVSGNLYKPLNLSAPTAGILCPHGHDSAKEGRKREQTQIRCATLARMGAIVFAWDMLGYGDSKQCSHDLKKGLKLQVINGIRSIDFLMSQNNIDKNRIGITGESGGGTQCFLLTALDDRIKVSAPVVMISSFFFGGCNCESGMQIHKNGQFQTNNVEIAALMAPKPMLMVSDGDDWTKFTPEVEYPFMQHIYQLYGQAKQVENVHLALEKHDYGPSKRKAVYPFMAKHLKLDIRLIKNELNDIDETAAKVLSAEELNVFNQEHPLPKNALMGDAAIDEMLR
jgi:hypothetical protein